jgi:hypothetical protein
MVNRCSHKFETKKRLMYTTDLVLFDPNKTNQSGLLINTALVYLREYFNGLEEYQMYSTT